MANPKAPAGGFQQGGWYEGRQYWDGTFSEPGQINPRSTQQGAGQLVSNEVIAQTNPANVSYIQQQRQQANLPAQPAQTASFNQAGAVGQPGGSFTGTPTPTFDPVSAYENLYKASGINDKQAQYSEMERQFIDAKAKINDNPFLSEATRVGKVAKLEQLFNERTANIKNDIATSKADIDTKLNLELKRFDIQSQQAKDALNQFNTLLSLGALSGASGEDIANITRSTGISSSMIQSAIQANNEKNTQTSTISFDDGTNQGFAIINDKTGEIINRQVVSASKPKSSGTGSSGSESVTIKEQFLADADNKGGQDVNGTYWGVFPQLVKDYAPYLTLDKIYSLYLQTNIGKAYGKPTENPAEMKQLYDYVKTGKE